MFEPDIISPMATGSGSWVIHRLLTEGINGYRLAGYHPNWTLFPWLLPAVVSTRSARLIHTTPDHALFFQRPGQPSVLTFHNYVLDRWMKKHSSWIQRIYYATFLKSFSRMAVNNSHAVTAVSHYTARLVQEDLTTSKPVKVIYNGIDVDRFKPATSSPYSRKEVRVLFSGNLIPRKGAHWLSLIARGLGKNIRIYYTQGLRTQMNLPADAKLQPLGSVPYKEMADRYRQMDLLVMPSVREGFGLAVAEAMSCGLPVVATDCSAIPELIDEGKGGFLCPVGGVETFAEKINLLADSPKLRREMGAYNRTKVEKMFTLDRMIKEYQDLFQEVLC